MINQLKKWFKSPSINTSESNSIDNQVKDYHPTTNDTSLADTNIHLLAQDADLEFLFHQLLEGVVNGWQDTRISQFFTTLEPKISQPMWLDWLHRYRQKLISSPAPNTQVASRMVILGKVTIYLSSIKVIGDLAEQIGRELLEQIQKPPSIIESTVLPSATVFMENEDVSTLANNNTSSLADILSWLQNQQPMITPPTIEIESEVVEVADPSVIMAQIAEQSHSEIQPLFSDSVYHLCPEDLFSIALKKAQAGDLDRAISLWQEAVRMDADFAPAWHNLGSAFAYLDRLPKAIECFDRALEINVHDYLSWNDRGNAFFRLQNWQESLMSWERVVGIQPDFYQAWYHRGIALEKLEQYSEALISYQRCLAINSDFKSAQKRLFNLEAKINDSYS